MLQDFKNDWIVHAINNKEPCFFYIIPNIRKKKWASAQGVHNTDTY